MRAKLLWASVALALVAAAPGETQDQIAASERAFAADGLERGIGPSFVTWAAPDGVVLRPDPVNARERYAKGPAARGLVWWPSHVGAARSGDLGFDFGPWTFGGSQGWFFTIWRKQPDGSWRWLLDHGFDGPHALYGPDVPLTRIAVSTQGRAGSASSAMDQVRAEEARIAKAAAAGRLAAALIPRIAADAWIGGLEAGGPATSPAVVADALKRRPQAISFTAQGGGASAAGDLAYTFGRATWSDGSKDQAGNYIRVWRRDRAGWRIVVDLVTPPS